MTVIWNEKASSDLQEIFDYIVKDSAQAALMVDDRICGQTDALIHFPFRGRPGQRRGTRELVIKDTPYIAFYRVEDDCIRIVRVLHGARRRPKVM